MKKFLKITILSLVSILPVILTACTKPTSKSDQNQKKEGAKEKVEISFMMPEWGTPSENLLNEFEKESGIKVKVVPTNWDDIRTKISTAAVGKNIAADVFEVDWSWVGEFKKAGWIQPINVSEEDKKDMTTISTFTIDNQLMAMPYSNDYRIGYYNTDMYKKAGIDKEPSTWDDVINDSKIIKEKKIVEYPISIQYAPNEKTTTTFLWLAYTRNNKVFNDDNTLNKEATLDTFKLMDKINKLGLTDPADKSTANTFPQLTKGEAAFMVGPSSFVMGVNNPKNSKVVDKVMPITLPGKDAKSKITVPFAEAVGISAYTKHKQECEKFVKWFTSADVQYKLYNELSLIPTRNSVIEKLLKDNKIKNPGAMLELAKVIKTPFPNGVPVYYTKMSTEIFNTINQFASGKLTVEQATDQLVEKVNAIVSENKQ